MQCTCVDDWLLHASACDSRMVHVHWRYQRCGSYHDRNSDHTSGHGACSCHNPDAIAQHGCLNSVPGLRGHRGACDGSVAHARDLPHSVVRVCSHVAVQQPLQRGPLCGCRGRGHQNDGVSGRWRNHEPPDYGNVNDRNRCIRGHLHLHNTGDGPQRGARAAPAR